MFPREFRYSPVIVWGICGFGGLALFGVGVYVLITAPQYGGERVTFLGAPLLVVGAAAFTCALGVCGLWLFVLRKNYAVFLSDDGLSYAHSQSHEAPLAWSEISRLRFRPILQRLEMIDRKGAVRFRVESQVQCFGELLRICGSRVTPPARTAILPRSFVRRPALNDLVMAIAIGIFFILAITDQANSFSFAAIGAFCAVLYLTSVLISDVRCVTVKANGVEVTKGFRYRWISFACVREVKLGAVQNEYTNKFPRAWLLLTDGSLVDIRPLSCDPFEVAWTVRQAMANSGAVGNISARSE